MLQTVSNSHSPDWWDENVDYMLLWTGGFVFRVPYQDTPGTEYPPVDAHDKYPADEAQQ